jgi:hypothetical protein
VVRRDVFFVQLESPPVANPAITLARRAPADQIDLIDLVVTPLDLHEFQILIREVVDVPNWDDPLPYAVRDVRFSRGFVDLAKEQRVEACLFETQGKATATSKKIDAGQLPVLDGRGRFGCGSSSQRGL